MNGTLAAVALSAYRLAWLVTTVTAPVLLAYVFLARCALARLR